MAIAETQLDTWSKQGSVTQSASTYATLKGILEDSSSPYAAKSYHSYLQGSYCNDTNVYAESDVDIVLQLDSTYYHDITRLNDTEKAAYDAAFSASSYSWSNFRSDVVGWLGSKLDIEPGKKAIAVPASGARRDADVLVAAKFYRFTRFNSWADKGVHEGICFFSDGKLIENYPKKHSANCTTKHQETNSWFKPTVRIFKNMRNRMLDDRLLDDGVAPSYFIEGLLYNVPKENFGSSYADTFVNCFNWIVNTDRTKLTTASRLHWLVRDNEHTSWPTANCDEFIDAARELWEQW